jgi:hypothetical protein
MQHCPHSSTKRIAIGALLLVLAMAGCDSKAESSSGATWSSPDTAPIATDSRASSLPSARDAEPSASSSPIEDEDESREAKTAPKPKASKKTEAPSGGGTKYTGCADGDCKVSFSGSVEFSLSRWTVSASVENGGVRVRLTKPNGLGGGGGFLAGPGCAVEMHADGGGRLGCDRPEAKPEPGGYVVHLLKLDGGTAVIRAILG